MATTKNQALLRQIGTLFNLGAIGDLTDGPLLERFARGDGEAVAKVAGWSRLVQGLMAPTIALDRSEGACRSQLQLATRTEPRPPRRSPTGASSCKTIGWTPPPGPWIRDSRTKRSHRQDDAEPCPLAEGAVYFQPAALVVDHPVRDAQAEARPLADRLRREERIEDVR